MIRMHEYHYICICSVDTSLIIAQQNSSSSTDSCVAEDRCCIAVWGTSRLHVGMAHALI